MDSGVEPPSTRGSGTRAVVKSFGERRAMMFGMAESPLQSVDPATTERRVSTGVDGNFLACLQIAAPSASYLYRAAVFASATLLFLFEPMVAKRLLPDFGGAASVWATCLMFFQCMLLLGYTYCHALTEYCSYRAQAVIHAVVMMVSLAVVLSNLGTSSAHSTGTPVWDCLLTLTKSIGVPFFALSATTPLLQVWFRNRHRASIPYHFFALSNIASLLALLAYPAVLEHLLGLRTQFEIWKYLFAIFPAAMVSIAAGVFSGSKASITEKRETPSASRRGSNKAAWIGLAACSSALLLGVTNLLCQQVAPLPLLWVVPLAVYLASFAIAFDWESLLSPRIFQWSVPAALVVLPWSLTAENANLPVSITASMVALFVICLFCHAQLSWLKPASGRPTAFYFCIAAGGALGSVFVAMVAPVLFSTFLEFYIALALAVALSLAFLFGYRSMIFVALCGILYGLVLQTSEFQAAQFVNANDRNFYGVVSVREYKDSAGEKIRSLIHGTVLHGSQFLSQEKKNQPLSYYSPESGIGLLLSSEGAPRRVGVIGLGAGTLATYGRKQDSYRFYEINPLVIAIAHTQFSYLRDSAAHISIREGDARLSLRREPEQRFDVLVVDAFSGDAIPVHLLTKEAFALFFARLSPKGVTAVHVSNKYLELKPVVAEIAASFGRSAWLVHSKADPKKLISEAEWILIPSGKPIQLEDAVPLSLEHERLWTDDYSNVLGILKSGRFSR